MVIVSKERDFKKFDQCYGINQLWEERINASVLQFKFSSCTEYLMFRVADKTSV